MRAIVIGTSPSILRYDAGKLIDQYDSFKLGANIITAPQSILNKILNYNFSSINLKDFE